MTTWLIIAAPICVLLFVAAILVLLWGLSKTWRIQSARAKRIRREAARIKLETSKTERNIRRGVRTSPVRFKL